SIMLEETTEAEIFFANMIGKSGDMIEYFVQAKSCSGMCETMPPVAPKGTYKVTIK
ncbi:peptidylarginine deiminase, partial [Clostridioides difficile]